MKHLSILAGCVCLITLLLPACAPQPEQQSEPVSEEAPSTDADVEAILNVAKEEMAAAKAGDTERLLAIMSDDCERIGPNTPAIRGELVRQDLHKSQEQRSIEFTYSNQEVGVDGDLAYHRYSYALTVTPKEGGEPIQSQGAGIQILRRQQDGAWKITKDIWNSDSPPAKD